jgi:hypothetical protein
LQGCPVDTGPSWSRDQLKSAIQYGAHASAMTPDSIKQLLSKVQEKLSLHQVTLVPWASIQHDPPMHLKISPIAMVPHKSQKFWVILDLSFSCCDNTGRQIPSINSTTVKTAPSGSIDQLGHALQRIIHAFAAAPPADPIFMAKWDIKDGFWRLDCGEGESTTSPVSPPLLYLLHAPPTGTPPLSPTDTFPQPCGPVDTCPQPRGCDRSTRPPLPACIRHMSTWASEPPRCDISDPFVLALITPDMVGNAITLHPTSTPHEAWTPDVPDETPRANPTTMGPPCIRGNTHITGNTTPRLRVENKRRRQLHQLLQLPPRWWTHHTG